MNDPVKLILIGDFTKFNIMSSKSMDVISCLKVEDAFDSFEDNINYSCYFNIIVADYNTKEDGFKLLKYFIEKNLDNQLIANSSGYPFFIFLNNKNFNKKILYSFYLENINDIKGLEPHLYLPSQNILFCDNDKESLINIITRDLFSYFFQKDLNKKNINVDYSASINLLFLGNTGCGKSTFINYLIGKKKAFQALSNEIKSFKANKYSHTKYPICFNDTEGFEVSNLKQKNIIDDNLKNNKKEDLTNRTHIAFYLIPGPISGQRPIDYSDIEVLLDLLYYKIHFYLIMTKEPNENDFFKTQALNFIKQLKRDVERDKKTDRTASFYKNNVETKQNLLDNLRELEVQLKERTFSLDVLMGKNKSIENLLKIIKNDLNEDIKIHSNFIQKAKEIENTNFKLKINSSGEEENDSFRGEDIKKELITPFFYMKDIKQISKKDEALRIIEEYKTVSGLKKLFFCYNSSVERNREEIFKRIKNLYSQVTPEVKIESELNLDSYCKDEKDSWFYQEKYTEKLGEKLIEIYEDEYKKYSDITKIMFKCEEYNRSILSFFDYIQDVLNMKLNETPITYDVDLI